MTDRRSAGLVPEPAAVVARIVGDVEPDLDPAVVRDAIGQAAPTRAQLRRLAHALADAPDLLTSGRPHGPPQIERLIRALREHGAKRLALPRCGRCGQVKHLPQLDGGIRICSYCDRLRRGANRPCVICGSAQVAFRDPQGNLRCSTCRLDGHDPVGRIADHITRLEPGLDTPTVFAIIEKAIPRPFQRHQVIWELDANPALLTGDGAHGSPRFNALIHDLLAAGAANIIAPTCPSCGRTVRLTHRRGEFRCCRRCYDRDQSQVCSRCQQRKPVASRTTTGDPICTHCFRADPVNHEPCSGCGRTALIVHRDHQRALCRRCWRAPTATCALCGRNKPCHFAATDSPRCEHCSRLMRHVPCSRCGTTRPVWTRTADDQPLCGACARKREPCAGCGKDRTVAARLPIGPLCTTCYRKHPASFRPCTECGTSERLHHHGLCRRCACRQELLTLLSHPDGGLHPHAEAIYQVLAASDPAAVLEWLTRSTARTVLAAVGQSERPPSHDTLDRHPPSGALQHLRKILVAAGILPQRDEHLAQVERWIKDAAGRVADPAERRILRRYAIWHHLRRLRHESQRRHITAEQAEYAQNDLRAAIKLINWLREHGRSLATCDQRDIDRWLANGSTSRYVARQFLAWTARRGHTRDIEIPVRTRSDTVSLLDEDHRWDLVRRLLHDDTLDLEDRIAGLLVLLYGQTPAHIARLKRDQVTESPAGVRLLLGATPLEIPAPLDDLLRQLTNRRHGHAVIGRTPDHPWLFPGGAPGHPISSDRLTVRLRALGISGRTGRNTALVDLAARVPPVVLARMLGLNITTTATWAERAGGANAAYAAELTRRQ